MLGMVALLAGFTVALGPLAMFNLYFMPYWINVMWLDAVTYLHHHGPEDEEKIPWYRGEVAPPPPPPPPRQNHCGHSLGIKANDLYHSVGLVTTVWGIFITCRISKRFLCHAAGIAKSIISRCVHVAKRLLLAMWTHVHV